MKVRTGVALSCIIRFANNPDASMSTAEIAQWLDTTTTAVRHALAVLRRDGLLETRGMTPGQFRSHVWVAGPTLLKMIEEAK